MVDDIVVGREDAVRQPVLAHEEPEIFDRVKLRRFRREGQDRDVVRHDEIVGHVPSRLVHDEDGMRIIGNIMGYFCKMLVHGVSITPGHHESGSLAELGADGTEDIG